MISDNNSFMCAHVDCHSVAGREELDHSKKDGEIHPNKVFYFEVYNSSQGQFHQTHILPLATRKRGRLITSPVLREAMTIIC